MWTFGLVERHSNGTLLRQTSNEERRENKKEGEIQGREHFLPQSTPHHMGGGNSNTKV